MQTATEQTVAQTQLNFEPHEFRQALSEFATGVTILACQGDGQPAAMTANSFTSISLNPALVMVSIANTAKILTKLVRGAAFSINILNGDQEDIAKWYGGSKRPADPEHWQFFDGLPMIEGAAVHLACNVTARHRHGDHHLVVAQVKRIANNRASSALTFHRGAFSNL